MKECHYNPLKGLYGLSKLPLYTTFPKSHMKGCYNSTLKGLYSTQVQLYATCKAYQTTPLQPLNSALKGLYEHVK